MVEPNGRGGGRTLASAGLSEGLSVQGFRSTASLEERFWAKVEKGDSCWEWQASRLPDGYGLIWDGRERPRMRAHRVAWEFAYGPIPDGMQVLHHCDNPPCVNPAHLFLGTPLDNARDRDAKGRGGGPKRFKAYCSSGHPFAGDNIYVDRNGRRHCRECRRIRKRVGYVPRVSSAASGEERNG